MRSFQQVVILVCLFIGIGGRLLGGYVNREANDDHAQVVQRILANESIDHRDSCWECFQPPLFYRANAKLASLRNTTNRHSIIKQMQFENVVFSLLSLYLLFLFFKREKIPWDILVLVTGFWLVNPALFSISIQSTNDTLIVLMASIVVYFASRYLRTQKPLYGIIAIAALCLAPHFKGSGIAVFLIGFVVMTAFIIKVKKHWWAMVLLLTGAYVLTFQSHYTTNVQRYGDPFTINQDKAENPPLFDDGKEFWKRPGISSVWSGYFKTQFISMLKTPHNINSGPDYPAHRTSFWAQMYGSFFHVQFLYHPWSWTSKHPDMMNLARIIFVLALFPTAIFIFGFFLETGRFFRHLGWNQETLVRLIHLGFFAGFLVFNIKYSYDYRDFGCIKAIFMLPAMISMTYIFIQGYQSNLLKKISRLRTVLIGLIVLLCSANLVFLLSHLTKYYLAHF